MVPGIKSPIIPGLCYDPPIRQSKAVPVRCMVTSWYQVPGTAFTAIGSAMYVLIHITAVGSTRLVLPGIGTVGPRHVCVLPAAP